MGLISLSAAFAGFFFLALAMDRHYGQIFSGKPAPKVRRAATAAGWTLLAAAAVPCVLMSGWSIGLTWWLGGLTAAAASLLLLLTYRPKAIPLAVLAAPVASGILYLIFLDGVR